MQRTGIRAAGYGRRGWPPVRIGKPPGWNCSTTSHTSSSSRSSPWLSRRICPGPPPAAIRNCRNRRRTRRPTNGTTSTSTATYPSPSASPPPASASRNWCCTPMPIYPPPAGWTAIAGVALCLIGAGIILAGAHQRLSALYPWPTARTRTARRVRLPAHLAARPRRPPRPHHHRDRDHRGPAGRQGLTGSVHLSGCCEARWTVDEALSARPQYRETSTVWVKVVESCATEKAATPPRQIADRPRTKCRMMTTTAMTMRMWMKAPPMCTTRKPRSHKKKTGQRRQQVTITTPLLGQDDLDEGGIADFDGSQTCG